MGPIQTMNIRYDAALIICRAGEQPATGALSPGKLFQKIDREAAFLTIFRCEPFSCGRTVQP
jgi:hypothetical protein